MPFGGPISLYETVSKGVTYHRASGLWHARIYANCKVVSLGYFQHRESAFEAYREAAAELHGQFANYGT
ncbi:hypothetical protein K6Y54_35510 [Burkholderia cenocepacia]|nr:hypothetical protein [Burkholderia cenocepacia]